MRPFDTLGKLVGKDVLVKTKSGMEMYGKLKTFDRHLNIVLTNVNCYEEGNKKNVFNEMLIRGDTIIFVT